MDAHHYAGDLFGAFRLEHLEALMPAHDIPRDLVPDDGIHIAELMQAAPDLFIRRIAGLQVFAGIIFCRFQHENGHFLNVYFRLYRWQKAHKINPFERPGAIFLRSEKTLYFCEIFHGRAPRSRRKRSRRFDPPWGRKADPSTGFLHGEVRKPTTPQDFAPAKRESRPVRWTSSRRSAKADCAARSSPRRSAKADRAARSSPRRSAKADRAARTSSRRSAKADHAARTSSRRSAKADNGGRLCPGGGFSGRAAGRNGALPYNARKSQFLRNGDVWATESLFLFAVLWLAFLPGQSETGVAGGGKARRPKPRPPPRRPAPTTATGSRFLRRQRERPPRRLRPSPPAREGSLGAPNDRTFPPGAERKARKEKGKEEPRMKRAPPL